MTLEDLEAAVTPEILTRGRACSAESRVRLVSSHAGRIQGVVAGALGDYRVRVFQEQQGLRSECECGYRQGMCKHAAALAWCFLNEPDCMLKVEDLQKQLCQMNEEALRDLTKRLAAEAPQAVAEALGMEFSPVSGRITWRFIEGLRRSAKRPDWLRAWWRVLKIVQADPLEEGNSQALENLLRFGLEHLGYSESPRPEEFWDSLEAAIALWRVHQPLADRSPSWWAQVKRTLRAVAVDDRRKLATCLADGLGADRASLLLPTFGFPLAPGDEEFTPFLEVAVAFLSGMPDGENCLQEWALFRVERALTVMDLYEEHKAWKDLKQVAKAGLKRFSRENGYIFRARLARAHLGLGEYRQAIALLKTNFSERQGYVEFVELMETADAVGEREEVLATACAVLKSRGRWGLLGQVLCWAGDLGELAKVADKLSSAEPFLAELAEALRANYPRVAREQWERRAFFLLEQGTRRAAREAVPVLIALKRLCREKNWIERWEDIRRQARSLLLDPVSRRMMGSLLEP